MPGRQPTSRRPRPLVDSGIPISPDSAFVRQVQRARHGQQRVHGLPAALGGPQALAPEDHHVAGVAQHVGGGAHRVGRGRRPRRSSSRRPAGSRPPRGRGRRDRRASPRRRAGIRARRPGRRAPPPPRRGRGAPRRRRSRRGSRGAPRGSRAARRCGARPCARAGRGSAPRPPARCPPPGSRRRGRCRTPARRGRGGRARAPAPRRAASRRATPPSRSRARRASGAGRGSPPRWCVWPLTNAAVPSPALRSAGGGLRDSARSHDTSRRYPPSRTIGAVMRSSAPNDW